MTTEQPGRVGVGRDGLEWVQKGRGKLHWKTNTQIQIHKYTNTQTHKYTNTQIHKYTDITLIFMQHLVCQAQKLQYVVGAVSTS